MQFFPFSGRVGVRLGDPSRHALAFAMVLALHIFVPDAKAEPISLSLTEAQHRALNRSRQLPSKEAAIAAARDMAVAAGQRPDPVLKAGIDNLPVSGAERFNIGSDFMTMRRIGMMQELTHADKLRLRAAQYDRAADKASAEKLVITAQIERDTALAWLDLYYSIRMAEVVRDQINLSELDLKAAEAAYRGGKRSQADVFEARGAIAAAQDRASDYDRRVRVAQTMLARWTGPLGEVGLAELPDIEHVRLDPATLDTALAHHPDIAVLDRQQEIARTEAQLAQANRTPDWTVEVALQHRGPAFSNMVSVEVSVPLPWDRRKRQDRELAAKLALADQAQDEREEMLRVHVAETRVMFDEWQNGRERLVRYRRQLLPLAEDRSAAALAAYRGGKETLGAVLAARRNQLEVSLQSLQLEADTARLWAQLNFLYPSGHAQSMHVNSEGGTQ